jgi:hypothetical protein
VSRRKKTPAEIRREAVQRVRQEAVVVEGMGDPEGAGWLRDLAKHLERIRLTEG